jgi:hypothetical protein
MNSSHQLDLALESLPRPAPSAGSFGSKPFAAPSRIASVLQVNVPLSRVPVDFFADPDGTWDFEALVAHAGFQHELGEVAIGALTEAYSGFPAGAAVVAVSAGSHIAIALVDCTGWRGGERHTPGGASLVQ